MELRSTGPTRRQRRQGRSHDRSQRQKPAPVLSAASRQQSHHREPGRTLCRCPRGHDDTRRFQSLWRSSERRVTTRRGCGTQRAQLAHSSADSPTEALSHTGPGPAAWSGTSTARTPGARWPYGLSLADVLGPSAGGTASLRRPAARGQAASPPIPHPPRERRRATAGPEVLPRASRPLGSLHRRRMSEVERNYVVRFPSVTVFFAQRG